MEIAYNVSRTTMEAIQILTEVLDKDITLSELISSIAKLNNGEAVAEDGIINEFFKINSRLLRQTIFNRQGHQRLPRPGSICSWNFALITPIQKGDKYDPDNYRAIAVGSILGKLFAFFLLNRLLMYKPTRIL